MREIKKKVFWGECARQDRMGHTYKNVYRSVQEKATDGDLRRLLRQKIDLESETGSEGRGKGKKWELVSPTMQQDGTRTNMIYLCFRTLSNNSQEMMWSVTYLLGKYEDLNSMPKMNV